MIQFFSNNGSVVKDDCVLFVVFFPIVDVPWWIFFVVFVVFIVIERRLEKEKGSDEKFP